MEAITTKFIGASNTRGSRIKATWGSDSLTIGWQYDKDSEGNHVEAARQLAIKMGLKGIWRGSSLGAGWVFVNGRESASFAAGYEYSEQ